MPGLTYLIVGATGNTGKETVRTLSALLQGKDARIIALTRNVNSDTVKSMSDLPGVEWEEKLYTEIDVDWVKARSIDRAFVASQASPSQFTEEAAFHYALLHAGVSYVVRTATIDVWMKPACPIWYGRQHWAIDTMLGSSDFDKLAFTSLRPNIFNSAVLGSSVQWVKDYRKTGKQTPLDLGLIAEDAKIAVVDPNDVGKAAGQLLALDDFKEHSGKGYIINGPEDITGREVLSLVEEATGVKVEEVLYKNINGWMAGVEAGLPRLYGESAALAGGAPLLWDGSCSLAAAPTSDAILKIAPPTGRPGDYFSAATSY